MDEVLFDKRGVAGFITLNRPQALNAVTLDIVRAMTAQLLLWADDPTIERVVITAAGDKAFSAGGDIRQLYDWGRARDDRFLAFYREEYQLNLLIKRFPKPYVALIDGIVMGGGVGVSFNGSHKICGDNILFAMPETGIGLFPDVGGTYFLPRCPGEAGLYLGLTGARIKSSDCCALGLVDAYVPSAHHDDLALAMEQPGAIDEIITGFARPVHGAPILEKMAMINQYFGADDLAGVMMSLGQGDDDWAAKTFGILTAKSPTSLHITFRQLRLGRNLSFEAAMQLEFRIVNRIMSGHDFFEGTRAVIIDKDHAPQWQPGDLSQISTGDVDAYFAVLPEELAV